MLLRGAVFFTCLCFILLSGCSQFPVKKEAATSPPQEEAKTLSATQSKTDIASPVSVFNKWTECWVAFLSEYNGAIIEMETVAGRLRLKRTGAEMRARIEAIPARLNKAAVCLGQLPPTDGLSTEHRDILAHNIAQARAMLATAEEIPPMLRLIAENPNDNTTIQAIDQKLAAANEISSCNEKIFKIRNELLKNKTRSFPR